MRIRYFALFAVVVLLGGTLVYPMAAHALSALCAPGSTGTPAPTPTPAATPTPLFQQQINDGANFILRGNDAASPCTSIADSSGGGHNATVHGGITCGATGGNIDGATALTFNGSTGYLSAAAPTQAYPFTIEFALSYSTINTGGIWDMNPGVGGTRDVLCTAGTVNTASALFMGAGANCIAAVSDGVWILWDVVYQSASQQIYLNGVLTSAGASASGTYAQGASIGIGALNGNTDFLAGSMQNYAIYPSALSAATVRKHAGAYGGF